LDFCDMSVVPRPLAIAGTTRDYKAGFVARSVN
jgi:hypothetical protein